MRKKHKENIIFENVLVEDFAAEAKCISRVEDKVIFIDGPVAPGDYADLRITKSKRSYYEATALNIKPSSPYRTQTVCDHFGTCGGCKWQHIDYATQLSFKTKQVTDALERIAKVDLPSINPILGSGETFYYRNKLEYTFSQNRWLTVEQIQSGEEFSRNALGFHVPKRYDKILHVDHCYLQPDPSNQIRNALHELAQKHQIDYYEQIKQEKGALRNLIIRTATTGDLMVIVQFAYATEDQISLVMEFLDANFPQITSLNYIINTKGNDTFFDLEVVNYKGLPYIVEEMEGLKYRVGPKSFYQTNSKQAYELYKITRDYAGLTGSEFVYDLYTGTGTIANFVARQAKKVIGLEYVEMAVEDAKVNSQINGIDNTEFYAGDMRKLLDDSFIDAKGRPDVVITDPPRAGMDEPVVQTLLNAEPHTIVYVSCNPATQARDLALLDLKYRVEAVQPVDMFPQTHHVENVVKLVKR
ncbi:23S rRNA (uracil(1939)-C(5))-methyltransferase RlmD [Flectobacillus roseus]|uniref:23S rRNA (Uracil(1939)-C(5))-methyltransferase RlmD n=1 Tax=Flectobacillus roseus TaxID=502259 RepID=A0ABT6Y4C5_9BACT|nr:23S rRNA (uracil(1939)-C(5))-methyltransferase RlmD [Flectobacillus roseus]MDI9858419.1 23S rRNA (uracil(1939)-C(5))-methyltransferase RlmD [Flectobacillus roseus]